MLEEALLFRTVLTSFNKTTCLGVFVFVVDSYFANDYANEVQKAVYIHLYLESVLYGKQWESYSSSALFRCVQSLFIKSKKQKWKNGIHMPFIHMPFILILDVEYFLFCAIGLWFMLCFPPDFVVHSLHFFVVMVKWDNIHWKGERTPSGKSFFST